MRLVAPSPVAPLPSPLSPIPLHLETVGSADRYRHGPSPRPRTGTTRVIYPPVLNRDWPLQVATSIILGCLSSAALGPSHPMEDGQKCRFENNCWPIPCRFALAGQVPPVPSSPHQGGHAGMAGALSPHPKSFYRFCLCLALGIRTHHETLLGRGPARQPRRGAEPPRQLVKIPAARGLGKAGLGNQHVLCAPALVLMRATQAAARPACPTVFKTCARASRQSQEPVLCR